MLGITLGTRLARTFGVLCGMGVSAFTVVSVPLSAWHMTWGWASTQLDGRLPWITLPPALALWEESWIFAWRGVALPMAPGWEWVFHQSLWMLLPLLGLLVIFHALIPMRQRIYQVSRITPMRVDQGSYLQDVVDRLRRESKGPRASVWIVPLGGIQAYALSGPISGHAIVIHQGALQQLPGPVVEWILAHEYGHILHGDTRSASLLILGMRSVHVFDLLRHKFANLMLRVLFEIPLLRLLTSPVSWIFRILSLIGRLGRRVGGLVFRLFDTWASRRMEYAADRYAAR
ncbi:MAG: M48 family metalloprotease, partial [Halomonadaceae bacterium]|nr:M48 family metalloprotease [Halomonadaceae bacterium]